jgi:hypothetical protein
MVTLTDNGFIPTRLVIKQGDTVTFKSDVSREFWPASDFHPTHNIYPAFDPRRPIEKGTSWDFVFERAGVWKYHDHLASDITGEIVVLDSKGAVVIPSCSDKNSDPSSCFQEKITTILKEQGLDKALDKMSELYDSDPVFKGSCHSVAHALGKAAYHLFEKGKDIHLTAKTAYCSYGFYHGFMEEMLQVSGDFQEARDFCAKAGEMLSTETAYAEGACYHGIGHGTVDGSDPRDWGDPKAIVSPGLDMCDKVDSKEPHFYRCASGAFNSLAIIYMGNQYGLKSHVEDPFSVCERWSDYRIKNPCYQEMNMFAMSIAENSLAKGIKLVEKIKDPVYAKLAMTSLSGVAPSRFTDTAVDFKRTVDECHAARADLIVPCIEGVPSGIMEFGSPGKEYVPALEFCRSDSLLENERLECLKTVFGGVRAYYSTEKQASICSSVEKKYKDICVAP